jgi:riboflavin biosynthesis pyrimidine reductase
VILEGGPAVHQAFWDRGLVDRVQMYVVPRAIGSDGVPWWATVERVTSELQGVRSLNLGADVLMEGECSQD